MCGTCGHAGADRDAPLVAQDGVDADVVLDARLQLLDGGGGLVPGHGEVLQEAAGAGGHVGDQVLRHQHLVVPAQVHGVGRDPVHRQVLWRRHWKKEGKIK